MRQLRQQVARTARERERGTNLYMQSIESRFAHKKPTAYRNSQATVRGRERVQGQPLGEEKRMLREKLASD